MEQRNASLNQPLVHLLREGSLAIPTILLTEYKRIGLKEEEVMLLLQIMMYKEKEQVEFPTIDQLQERMNRTPEEIMMSIQRLVNGGYLKIEVGEENGIRAERFSTEPLLILLAKSFQEQLDQKVQVAQKEEQVYQNIFSLFEQEMGRPLSPFECEQLGKWLDEDQYREELIVAALREAVFCNKVSVRYVDRILLEWHRNNVRTPDDAIEYSRKFRKQGVLFQREETESSKETETFPLYNWVNP